MKKEITINKEWHDKLVVITNKLLIEIENKNIETLEWLHYLVGYVYSLDVILRIEQDEKNK